MTTDPLLSLFPTALRTLILCGGDGLEAVYGPLLPASADGPLFILWHGDPRGPIAMSPFRHMAVPLEVPECWSLPLTHWRARLAMVGAKLLGLSSAFAPRIIVDIDRTIGIAWVETDEVRRWWWDTRDGSDLRVANLDLPSLPHLLTLHAPEVALVLAIWEATRPAAK